MADLQAALALTRRAAQSVWLLACMTSCGFNDAGAPAEPLKLGLHLDYAFDSDTTKVHIVDNASVPNAIRPTYPDGLMLVDVDSHAQIRIALASGEQTALWAGYHRRVHLVDVARTVVLCALEGPAAHVILNPLPGTAVTQGSHLNVAWRAPDGMRADDVDVALLSGAATRPHRDQGEARFMPKDLNRAMDTVSVTRTMKLQLSGKGADDLAWSSYQVSAPFRVIAPALADQ